MKKYIYIIVALFVISIALVVMKPSEEALFEFDQVKRSDLIQEVSVSGKIVSAEKRDLSFERTGKIIAVYTDVGDEVSAGDALVILDSQELEVQLKQALANLEVSRIVLQELKNGTRKEEIQIAETSILNTQRNLNDAQVNLETIQEKAEINLAQTYDGTVTVLQAIITNVKNALVILADIQGAHFNSFDQQSANLAASKADVIKTLFGVESNGYWEAEYISNLNGGLFGKIQSLDSTTSTNEIDLVIIQTKDVLLKIRDAMNMVPIVKEMTIAEKASLISSKTTILTDITTVSGKEQSINLQRILNTSSIDIAQTNITATENALSQAVDQLSLKESGSTSEQISAQEARIRALEASVELLKVQISKVTLYTPIDGFVTKQDAEVGIIAVPGKPIVSVTSSGLYEVETYIPEGDITKISLGDSARISLDAYADDTELLAEVAIIDQTETTIEGVPTYKVTLLITQGIEFVKSGMTADIIIQTEVRESVLNIPSRAIVIVDSNKFVRIVSSNGEVENIPITVGLRSSDGRTEILGGLSENQEIITFVTK